IAGVPELAGGVVHAHGCGHVDACTATADGWVRLWSDPVQIVTDAKAHPAHDIVIPVAIVQECRMMKPLVDDRMVGAWIPPLRATGAGEDLGITPKDDRRRRKPNGLSAVGTILEPMAA